MENTTPAVVMQGITKSFGSVVANDRVDLTLYHGEILALLGENGSGKTTLVNALCGAYIPDAGRILIDGKPVSFRSPRDAYACGVGVVYQHFKLVEVLTATENIALGLPGGVGLDRKALARRVGELCEKYGFTLELNKKIYNMSVSEKQTVEIVKSLYRGADILILDEPTAVLTPQETDALFSVMRSLKADGKSILIITHKLNEVLSVSHRVTILHKGKNAGTVVTRETDAAALAEAMVGERVSLDIHRPTVTRGPELLRVEHLSCTDAEGVEKLRDVSFSAYGGEILGIAGVANNGQKELCEAIAGVRGARGRVLLHPAGSPEWVDVCNKKPNQRPGVSLAFVPEDRLGMGLAGSLGMVDNLLLRGYRETPGPFVERKVPRALCERLVEELQISLPDLDTPIQRLSGGNVQKVLVGRETHIDPEVLLAAYPVRGLDVGAAYKIYDIFNEKKTKGKAVVFVGEDLDVLMALCDRILVLCGGRVSGVADAKTAAKEQLGALMMRQEAQV